MHTRNRAYAPHFLSLVLILIVLIPIVLVVLILIALILIVLVVLVLIVLILVVLVLICHNTSTPLFFLVARSIMSVHEAIYADIYYESIYLYSICSRICDVA